MKMENENLEKKIDTTKQDETSPTQTFEKELNELEQLRAEKVFKSNNWDEKYTNQYLKLKKTNTLDEKELNEMFNGFAQKPTAPVAAVNKQQNTNAIVTQNPLFDESKDEVVQKQISPMFSKIRAVKKY